jgi:hypothetical protein
VIGKKKSEKKICQWEHLEGGDITLHFKIITSLKKMPHITILLVCIYNKMMCLLK